MNDTPQSKHETQPSERGLPKGDPWIVYVDVYLNSVDPGDFEIKSCLPTKPHNVGGKYEDYLVFENNFRPGFTIFFQLHDLTKQGYRFPKHDDDAVWSHYGDDCPDDKSPGNDVFESPKVQGDPTILEVRYKNKENNKGEVPPGPFRYTLNVTTTGDRPYLPLDPGGTGTNGQSSP